MNTASTPTATERLLGLLLMTGAMTVLSALPVGIVLSFQEHFKFGTDWRWSITEGAVTTIAIAVVGGGFLGVGQCVLGRRRRTK